MSADLPDLDAVLAQIAADPTSLPAVLAATRLLRAQAATLNAVRALHRPSPEYGTWCVECSGLDCDGCPTEWPCPTIRALDGDPA